MCMHASFCSGLCVPELLYSCIFTNMKVRNKSIAEIQTAQSFIGVGQRSRSHGPDQSHIGSTSCPSSFFFLSSWHAASETLLYVHLCVYIRFVQSRTVVCMDFKIICFLKRVAVPFASFIQRDQKGQGHSGQVKVTRLDKLSLKNHLVFSNQV